MTLVCPRIACVVICTATSLLLVSTPGLAAPGNEQFSSGSTAKPSAQLGSDPSVCNDPKIAQREQQTNTTARLFPYLVGGGKEGQLARVLEETVGVTNGNGACNGRPGVVEFINNSRVGDANKIANEVFAGSGAPSTIPPNLLAQGTSPAGYPGGSGAVDGGGHPGPIGANCQKGAPGAYDPSQNPNCKQPFVFKPMVPTLDEPLKGAVKTTGQGGGAAPLQAKATVAIASGPALQGSANVEDGGASLGVLQVTIGKGWRTGHKAAGVVKTGTFSRASGLVEAFKDGTYAFRVDTLFYRDGSAARYVNFEIPMSR